MITGQLFEIADLLKHPKSYQDFRIFKPQDNYPDN